MNIFNCVRKVDVIEILVKLNFNLETARINQWKLSFSDSVVLFQIFHCMIFLFSLFSFQFHFCLNCVPKKQKIIIIFCSWIFIL
ncbi:hypothetical protein OIU77_029054 [Salix suchowensis]|uniref:Uncharacterized protein n=1 Tax=Salix suchowensis TaxID=1278906 RepID=A0ABQ9BJZ0_9ROSI|nr:hypothetical protein OIU77_029054 [Salix suchowensis]